MNAIIDALNTIFWGYVLIYGLLAVGIFFLLAFLPVSLFGGRGAAWFPSGNMLGAAGGTIRGLLTAFVGRSIMTFQTVAVC